MLTPRAAPTTSLAAAFALALSAVGCGAALRGSTPRPSASLIVHGEARVAGAVRTALGRDDALPIELRATALPNESTSRPLFVAVSRQLAEARRLYVNAEFARCLEALGAPRLPHELLGAGRRDLAARVMFWSLACRVGAGLSEAAARDARAMAVLELEAPPDVEATTPEVEAAFAEAQRALAATPRVTLRVVTDATGAAVSVDGRAPACVAPCAIDVFPGDHVVGLAADGLTPAWRAVRVEAPAARFELAMVPAPPRLAAQQWTDRYGMVAELESAPSLRLLARAVTARNLVVVSAEPRDRTTQLRGVLLADGAVAARAERRVPPSDDLAGVSRALVRDLLVRGGVVVERPLHQSPAFWAIVGATAVAAVVVTSALLYNPPVITRVGFR